MYTEDAKVSDVSLQRLATSYLPEVKIMHAGSYNRVTDVL